MTIELYGVKYENVENFEKFLQTNLKKYYPENLEIYLDELSIKVVEIGLFNTEWNEEKTIIKGVSDYELNKFDTFSGCPESVKFDVKYFTEDDGDSWDMIITF